MTIEQFCIKHNACEEGLEWALANCTSMQEVWDKAEPEWLIWVAACPNVLTDKELRLFAVFCARQVQHLMTDLRSLAAIDVAEKYAHGKASNEELVTARLAAWAAARDVAGTAAWGAAWTAEAATRAAAWAAWAAADAVAWAAGEAARSATALESQAKWLRENTKPIFTL